METASLQNEDVISHSKPNELSADEKITLNRTAAREQARRGISAAITYIWAISVVLIFTPVYQDFPITTGFAIAVNVFALFVRIALYRRFENWYGRHQKLWHRTYDVAVWLAALSWGALSSFALNEYGPNWVSFVIVVITMAMCGGAFTSFAMRYSLAAVFFAIILIPLIVVSYNFGGSEGWSLTITFSVWLVYCWYQAKLANRAYYSGLINAIRLDAETQRRLHELTYIDSLTGMPNRTLFADRLRQALLEAKRTQQIIGVLSIDIDQFMKVNDTLGHTAGDELLKLTGQRMRDTLRANDTVARITADQFAVIVSNLDRIDELTKIAGKLLTAVHAPVSIAGLEIYVSISIGIAVFPQDGKNGEALFKNAEGAMLRACANGGNTYRFFESQMNDHAIKRLTLESRLQRALERDEFILHYQPKLSLSDGKITGVEALVRWQPKDSNLVPPNEFIPLLEDTGLIVPVGEWILRTACLNTSAWHSAGLGKLRVAVNLSARQFRESDIIKVLTRVLSDTCLNAKDLEIEITESLLMEDTSRVQKILTDIRDLGVSLAIDDFGTGFSSLSYLKRMPIGTVKIDRSFVKDLTTDASDAALVQAVIAMAQSLKLHVVAEGVETAEQAQFLRDQGCDEMQGFYFSKPIKDEDFRSLLASGKTLSLPTPNN